MNRYPISSKASQKGAVLLESLIAVLIFSLGVLALAGLQAAMLKNTGEARLRAEASFIAQDTVSEMWIGGNALGSYIKTDEVLPQLPGGKLSVSVSGAGEVKVTVKWTQPGGAEHAYITNAIVALPI